MTNKTIVFAMLALVGYLDTFGVPSERNSEFGRGEHNERVELCHVPPGNPAAAHTIIIGEPAVEHHLANHTGDHLGECSCEDYGDCDTGTVVETADTGFVSSETGLDTSIVDTGSEDTGTTTSLETGYNDTGYDTGVSDTGLVVQESREVWVQNGCNTVPGVMSFFGLIFAALFIRRNR